MLRILLTSSALLGLAACSGAPEESKTPEGDPIECALGPGAELVPVCLYEIKEEDRELIIWHPDGGFRRFDLLPGGAGVASTDGAEDVIQGVMGGSWEITVGQDRYRIPINSQP